MRPLPWRAAPAIHSSTICTCCSRCSAQDEGIVVPILQRVGVNRHAAAHSRPSRRPRATQSRATRSRPSVASSSQVRRWRREARPRSSAMSTSPRSTCCCALAMPRAPTGCACSALLAPTRAALLDALKLVRGSAQGHRPDARTAVPGAAALHARSDGARAQGQARSGHRTRRGDPPRHSGALAPHEEQSRAHWRTWRGQDRHCRRPRAAHRSAATYPKALRNKKLRFTRPRRAHRRREVSRRVRGAPQGGAEGDHRRPRDVYVVFIDEMHTLVGAGKAEGSMDAGNMLKPMLARGELRVVGATTLDEYRKHVEKDAALERRFQPVFVGEPSVESTIAILRGLKERYEAHHGVRITDGAVVAAATLSQSLHRRPFPSRQGDRPHRRGGVAPAHRDRLGAAGDRRSRATHRAARDRTTGAAQGDRSGFASSAAPHRARARRAQGKGAGMRAQWQQEKETLGAVGRIKQEIEQARSRPRRRRARATSTRPPKSRTAAFRSSSAT